MKIYIYSDYEAGSWLEKEPISSIGYYEIDVSEEFFEEEQRIKNEYEEMQTTLNRMHNDARRVALLKSVQIGVKPKGFG